MERLSFELPDFIRTVWSSPAARDVWGPRIAQVSSLWPNLERLAVVEGIKPATLQVCSPDELTGLTQWAIKHGLVCVVLGRLGVSDGYSNSVKPVVNGEPWAYRIVITEPEVAALFIQLWEKQDSLAIGAALGFPYCCTEFFQRNWPDWKDLTYPMVQGIEVEPARDHFAVGGYLECNILLRWLGLRFVSHLPCSFYCEATETLGKKMATLALRHGYVKEMDWLSQILNWPIRWSSLHGVAIITTPVCRIVTNSTALAERATIDRDGPGYPEEGARGGEFPFRVQHALTVHGANDYSDNGFQSMNAMRKAHSVILEAFGSAEISSGAVIDLGCGNGKLLEEILSLAPEVKLAGVEIDGERFQKAARRLLKHDPELYNCDISATYYWQYSYEIGIISLNRLNEIKLHEARALLKQISQNCKLLIVYSYEDSEWPGLEGISEFFRLRAHFSGDNTCAIISESRREYDKDHL